MKVKLPLPSLFVLFAGFLAAPLFARAPINTLTPQEKAEGWQLLFDGHTLTGWRGYGTEEPPRSWRVEHGLLFRTFKTGDLMTKEQFGDFELSLDWKMGPDAANSGIIYRIGLGQGATYRSGPEYQILDLPTYNRLNPTQPVGPKQATGALYDLGAPCKDVANPVGQWNHTLIIVKGWRIQHWLNGTKLLEADLSTPEGKDLIAHSKFADMPGFASRSRGYIALQDHTGTVYFRNIKIRELK